MHKITSLSPTNPHLAHCSILPLSSFNPPPHLRHVDDASLKVEEFYFVKYNMKNTALYPLKKDER
ncbi:MAG: hypothetical protein QXE32_03850 [Sulfolobales archaeon]